MRMRLSLLGAVLAAVALVFSCKTAPPPAEPEPEVPSVEVVPEPVAEPKAVEPGPAAPTELRDTAAELRKKAFDFGLKDILPAEYAEAEKAYVLGTENYEKDNAASAAAYEDSIQLFKNVLETGLPLVASNESEQAWKAQETAAGKGAVSYYEKPYDATVESLNAADELKASGDYEAAIAAYREAAARFNAIGTMCDAANARDEIERRGYAEYDTSNWNLAEQKLASASELIDSDAAAARSAADEAVLRYRLVMQNALLYYAGERKNFSDSERERAMDIKADVAAREQFEDAVALYESAQAYEDAEDYESAAELYDQAADGFNAAHDIALTKMQQAQDELNSLDEALDAAAER
jgi:hypothetical protein